MNVGGSGGPSNQPPRRPRPYLGACAVFWKQRLPVSYPGNRRIRGITEGGNGSEESFSALGPTRTGHDAQPLARFGFLETREGSPVMETETVDLWLKVIGSYGFPIASVLALFWLFVHAAQAVWTWLTPRIDKVIDAHMTFLQTLTENDTRHTEAMETLTADGKTGHSTTHNKLDTIGEKVHAIHAKVVK